MHIIFIYYGALVIYTVFFFLRMFNSFMFWINCVTVVFIGDVLTPHSIIADGLSAHCLLTNSAHCMECELDDLEPWYTLLLVSFPLICSHALCSVVISSWPAWCVCPPLFISMCLCWTYEHMSPGVKLTSSLEWTASSGLMHGFYHDRLFSCTVMTLELSNCSSTCSGLQKPAMVSVSQNWPLPCTSALQCWLPTYSSSFESCTLLARSPRNPLQHV